MLQLTNLSTGKKSLLHNQPGFMKRVSLSTRWQWLNEPDQIGYRSGGIASLTISPVGFIDTVGTFTNYRGHGELGMFFHATDFSLATAHNDCADDTSLDSMDYLTVLRDGSFLFTDEFNTFDNTLTLSQRGYCYRPYCYLPIMRAYLN
ncbi:MAG TPA: hypothetical protein PLB10_06385 [Thiolinea sp.]|nr:hypothetical protein [Thiolinea sp.]